MRLEAWLKPYLDPDFWKWRKPLTWTTTPSSPRTPCTPSIRQYLHEHYLHISLYHYLGNVCSYRWKEGRAFSLEPSLSREQEGALACTQRYTAAVQLHPALASLGRKEKQVGVQSSQWKSNVKTTIYRQAKQGQFGQGFLAAVSFSEQSPVAAVGASEWALIWESRLGGRSKRNGASMAFLRWWQSCGCPERFYSWNSLHWKVTIYGNN